ncbi:hypothetical protein [Rubellicoccus peritrichatus]|uniref:CBM-cenC domain-containing protein n=1 Tax=Rubellicoccus peritrichatus TaxID=3080537 RepID=A0AAQ3LBC5_9BACT|nr:hypothetical protein [Puniceicoccus sp. CR14]WOO42725.1 hypothetical protein RZN69_06450 [Puniceicoccus sp. CR14]
MNSLKVISAFLAFATLATFASAQSLIPAKPNTKFWYPPYSKYQPSFDAEGVITVDLSQAAGKNMAVLEIEVPSGSLSQGSLYKVSFDVKATPAGPLILNVPEPKPDGSVSGNGAPAANAVWAMARPQWTKVTAEFLYDPTVNKGGLTLFWNSQYIQGGSVYQFRNIQVVAVE